MIESQVSSLDSQLLTPARLAWVMDVSHSTVEEWVRRRELASFRKGRVRRFEPGAVLEFIVRHTLSRKGRVHSPQSTVHSPLANGDWERIERLIESQLAAKLSNANR